MNLEQLIKNRVSQKTYLDLEVNQEEVMRLLDVAVYAPNHKMRQPWRFIMINGLAKDQLKERYLSVLQTEEKEKVSVVFDKLTKAPLLIACVMKTSIDFDVEIEDIQANAAMIMNFMLLAEDNKLATHWKTPSFIKSDKFKEVLGLSENELVTGLVMVGYADVKAKPKPRQSAQELTTFYE